MNLQIAIKLKQGDFLLDIDETINEDAVGVFGPSGCGKSTLLRCLAGLARPQLGRICLDGDVLYDDQTATCVPPHKRRIGVVFQDARLFPHWSTGKNIAAAQPRNETRGPFRFDHVVELLELGGLLDRPVDHLSGGEKQRVALARALLAQPRLLLMDEPVSGLDCRLKEQVLPFLARAHEEFDVPCIIVSHELTDILPFTQTLLLMDKGRVAARGPLGELLQDPGSLQRLRGAGAMNTIPAVVTEHDRDAAFTRHRTENGRELISGLWTEHVVGTRLIAGLRPEEITLACGPIPAISAQNQLRGRIERIIRAEDRMLCLVDVGVPLLADVTAHTVRTLSLRPGAETVVLFKAQALRQIGRAVRPAAIPA